MPGKLSSSALLGYKDFFDKQKPRPIKDYVDQLGREFMFKTSAFFLSHFRINAIDDSATMLKRFFTYQPLTPDQFPEYRVLAGRLSMMQQISRGQTLTLVSVEPFLRMVNWLQENPQYGNTPVNLGSSDMLAFFEVVMLFNQKVINDFRHGRNVADQWVDELKEHRRILAEGFPQNDFQNVNYLQLLITQCYKLIELLEFINDNQDYTPLLNHMLEHYKCKSKEDYMNKLYHTFKAPLSNNTPEWTNINVPKNAKFEDSCNFLEKLAIDSDDSIGSDQDDYIALRNKPLFKREKGNYRVIYDALLLKKVYNGTFFFFSTSAKNNEGLFRGDFLGRVRREFSESRLLYGVMDNIYRKQQGLTLITGDQFQKIKMKAEPDYYLRDNNNVLLFESKDFFVKGSAKLSYDFRILEPEFKKNRFDKAVKQLAGNIVRTLEMALKLDKDYDPVQIKIYPIVLVHDSLYSSPGLNYWINRWLNTELLELLKASPSLIFDNVMPLTILEIDTLILYEKQFQEGVFDLFNLLTDYHAQVQLHRSNFIGAADKKHHARQSALPFAEFLTRYRYEMGITPDTTRIMSMLDAYDARLKKGS
jgi:hypothetical protein